MKKYIKALVAIILSVVISVTFFGCTKQEEEPPTETTESTTAYIPPKNVLTGEEISSSSDGKRPIAVVVENHPDARPQWGIGTADIVCEGEVEGGISRMMWIYADRTKMPEQVGPLRSARPSFVEFSTFFDSIFVHWGGSHSKGNYTGGYETISAKNIDHIDGMGGGALFGRSKERKVSSEHTGVMNCEKIADVIDSNGFRDTLDENNVVSFKFNETSSPAGDTAANKVNAKFSSRTDTRRFTYSSDDKKYHTSDWETDTAFQNLLFLNAKSNYITAPYNGSTTTYLNYEWTSGTGTYVADGKACDITWSADNGKLSIKDSVGADITLNVGQSYIGFVSSNNGGSVDCLGEQ